jgi:hypothetical protein
VFLGAWPPVTRAAHDEKALNFPPFSDPFRPDPGPEKLPSPGEEGCVCVCVCVCGLPKRFATGSRNGEVVAAPKPTKSFRTLPVPPALLCFEYSSWGPATTNPSPPPGIPRRLAQQAHGVPFLAQSPPSEHGGFFLFFFFEAAWSRPH